ncbi:MAG: hypothetical protein QOK15_2828, partial [Nocardioidaceae bacterium]|nr:hypothetical protein [Nocardioidaceae bacterium]
MTTEPAETPQPDVLPSSTPDGPQVIPTEGTPEGEPGPDPQQVGFDNRGSTPNASGPHGAGGDMGVSSERTGPDGPDPRGMGRGGAAYTGTGSKGGSTSRTDGGIDVSPTTFDAPDVSQTEMHPDRDDARDDTSGGAFDPSENVDRTVGEPRPEPIPSEGDQHRK